MAQATWWWVAAGIAVAVELGTGTFYLLMIAAGLAAGAIAAHLGLDPTLQVVAAALVGGGAVAAWHAKRRREPPGAQARANPDVNPDIGEVVQVDAWGADGSASVHYRGARWTAVAAPGTAREPGPHRIREVVGNRLVVEKA
ncbi:NfeD family protein [Ramlibacter sp. PS4R-6]|uniref:NfeD family protein n=1 Tax=Ramlibacter sp. PS4R-6 TaxID=3133438 RepID=UPI0030B70F21